MGGLLILVGLVGFLFGLVNLVRPLDRLRVETRGQAGLVVAGSLVVMIVGGALLPPNSDSETVSSATTVVLSTSTSTSKATTSTAQLTTTSTSLAPNSSLASTTTISGENLALDVLLTIPIELNAEVIVMALSVLYPCLYCTADTKVTYEPHTRQQRARNLIGIVGRSIVDHYYIVVHAECLDFRYQSTYHLCFIETRQNQQNALPILALDVGHHEGALWRWLINLVSWYLRTSQKTNSARRGKFSIFVCGHPNRARHP